MDALKGIIQKWAGKAVAWVLTSGIAFVVGREWLSADTASQVALVVGPLLVSAVTSALTFAEGKIFERIPADLAGLIRRKIIEAETTFESGTGEQKKAFVVESVVQAYTAAGLDLPWIPAPLELSFVRKAAAAAVEAGMPWLMAHMNPA